MNCEHNIKWLQQDVKKLWRSGIADYQRNTVELWVVEQTLKPLQTSLRFQRWWVINQPLIIKPRKFLSSQQIHYSIVLKKNFYQKVKNVLIVPFAIHFERKAFIAVTIPNLLETMPKHTRYLINSHCLVSMHYLH